MARYPTFPGDENGDGLPKPCDIEFTVVLPDPQAAEPFARRIRADACVVETTHSGCVAELPWDVRIVTHMLPTHAGITAFEKKLDAVAAPLGGRNDGWGGFEQ